MKQILEKKNEKQQKKIKMKNKDDWMKKLVENYQVPTEQKKPTKILTDKQKKIILDKN